ncbi:30S ribosomal protein S9 [Candidatus Roizmanbacteria bacterium]|nr:30S ribosomal protein S9 [Candidatus Roizmanbacteria bacterium]
MARKPKALQYYEAVGRRKSARARVRLYLVEGKEKVANIAGLKIKQGEIFINKKPIEVVFSKEENKVRYLRPLALTESVNRFAISALIKGGGRSGWLDAFIHGLSRALEKTDREGMRPILKKEGYLTRDPRVKERRKVGTGGKARRKKQSPKR